MLSDGRNRYAYDDFGRLASAVTAEGDIQKNCYDAEGLRAEMEENGRLVQFLYNEDREVVAEKDYSGNIIRYIRGLGLISSDSENAKTYYHYVCDGQGSVSHIIRGEDKESGVSEQGREQDREQDRILNHYEYDAFGNTISCKEQVENRFRYQGEQYDPITRQYYLRARYYNPVIGRFIQEDTYYGDGLNLYEYCRNNTITYKDPTGHKVCPTQKNLYAKYREEGMNAQDAFNRMRKELGFVKEDRYSSLGQMSKEDGEAYTRFWEQVESGEPRWGERPNAEMLYEKNYIENHVRNFENGGSYLVSKKVYDLRIKDNILNPQLGRPGELFISTHEQINQALIESNGSLSKLEKIMGFDSGTYTENGGVVRIDIKNPVDYEIRLPSGNEYGANSHFVSGGKTDGGALEAVINNVPNTDKYRTIILNPFEIVNGVNK